MTRTARIWIKGGSRTTGAREHDEEFYFEDELELMMQLRDLRVRWRLGHYDMLLHGQEHLKYYSLPEGDVGLIVIPLPAPGEECVLPPILLDLCFCGGVVLHKTVSVPVLVMIFIVVLG